MSSEAEKYAPLETGGSFMGYVAKNNDIVITDLIEAGTNAERYENAFIPDQEYQLEEFSKIYFDSNRTKNYLGDWHTHPNHTANLSLKDKRTLTLIANSPDSQNSQPLMIILSGLTKDWTLNAFQFDSGRIYLRSFFTCKYKQLPYVVF